MAGGLTAGLALGGAGISFAASSGSSSTSAPPSTSKPSTPNAPNTPAKPGRGPHGFGFGFGFGREGFGFGGLGRVVHGQATVRTNSGYQTIVFQVGTADAAGTTAGLSVTSSDGFNQAYQVNSSTTVNAQLNGITSIKKGDQVQVIATQKGGVDTAVRITDLTALKQSGSSFGFGPGANAGQPANEPHTAEAGPF
jgi:hypothetical protein